MECIKDVYFLKAYASCFAGMENAEICEFEYSSQMGYIYYIFFKRRINQSVFAKDYWDIVTPYGYGGPVVLACDAGKDEQLVAGFSVAFYEYCKDNNIVSEFIRFHPLIENHIAFRDYYKPEFNRNTVCVDLCAPNVIKDEVTSKCRNMIRKAEKNGIRTEFDFFGDTVDAFFDIYTITMKKNKASDYYYFSKDFFLNFIKKLPDNCFIVNAYLKNQIVSSSMFLYSDKYVHYHFSGTVPDYYNLAANNLIISSVIDWGVKNGKIQFHLGGGFSIDNDDPLFVFKKSFSKNGLRDFYIGRKIYDADVYQELLKARNLSYQTDFFPAYRA